AMQVQLAFSMVRKIILPTFLALHVRRAKTNPDAPAASQEPTLGRANLFQRMSSGSDSSASFTGTQRSAQLTRRRQHTHLQRNGNIRVPGPAAERLPVDRAHLLKSLPDNYYQHSMTPPPPRWPFGNSESPTRSMHLCRALALLGTLIVHASLL